MTTKIAQDDAEHKVGAFDASPAKISTLLLDLYRLSCMYAPWGTSAGSDPSIVIGSPLLERILKEVHADAGALVLAHLPKMAPPWSPPNLLSLTARDRILALSHTQPNQLPGLADAADSWLSFSMPLPGTGARAARDSISHSSDATHAVLLLRWQNPARQEQWNSQARALLPALAEAVLAAIGMILLHDRHASLEVSARASESSLRETETVQADWQQAFDAISDPVSIVDADYHLIRANAAYRALFGGDAMLAGVHQCFASQEGRAAPCEGCPLPHTLATGQPGYVERERSVPSGPDGQVERRVFQTWTYPARNHVGVVDHVVEIIKDVTDQERLREATSRAEALCQADRLKAELLGTVSHELRSPLAAIRGYAETLQRHERRITHDERREFLTAIVEASGRLQIIIDHVLELSELATGTMPVQRVAVDVLPILREAVAVCARKAVQSASRRFSFTESALDVAANAEPTTPLVFADPRLLREVLDQVLENAVRFSPDGGQIRVGIRTHAAREGDGRTPRDLGEGRDSREERDDTQELGALSVPALEIMVEDSGMGIPSEHLGRIFDRFHRVDTRLTRDVDGLGVGLAICQQIIELHEGAIWAESVPGQGSMFHIVLPLAAGDASREPATDIMIDTTETENH